jgi:hypothetical protein
MTREERSVNEVAEENAGLRDIVSELQTRLSRIEYAAGNQNKMRKWDEMNDPLSLKKTGHIPSFDRIDPVISITRKGNVWLDANDIEHDEQIWSVKTHGGVDRMMTTKEYKGALEGNSIRCIVNDWDDCMKKVETLDRMRQEFQRSNGRDPRFDTVGLFKEIKRFEDAITINVTLSEDGGKSFTGKTLDVPWQTVFNALA